METFVEPTELARRLEDETVRVVDVRWDLEDPAAGRRAYAAGHVPGAVHLGWLSDWSMGRVVSRTYDANRSPPSRHPRIPSSSVQATSRANTGS